MGVIKDADIQKQDINISCGDEIEMYVKLDTATKKEKFDNQVIKEIKFNGKGCVICMASASILTEEVTYKKIKDVKEMNTDSLLELIQLQLTPARIKCAMLSLVTLKKGIMDYESKL
jgi:nitrogen fixation NifU-like protein